MAQNHCAGQKPAFPPLTPGEWGLGGRSQKACLLLRTCPSPFSGGLPFISKLSAKQDGTNFEVPTLMPPVPPSQFSLLNFSLFSSKPQRSTSSDRHMPTPVLSVPRPPSSLQVHGAEVLACSYPSLNSTPMPPLL